jgi:hypothetical protein
MGRVGLTQTIFGLGTQPSQLSWVGYPGKCWVPGVTHGFSLGFSHVIPLASLRLIIDPLSGYSAQLYLDSQVPKVCTLRPSSPILLNISRKLRLYYVVTVDCIFTLLKHHRGASAEAGF